MKELYEKVSKDEALQAKLFGILGNAEKLGEDAVKEKLVQFAKEEGCDITIEEMQAFFNDLAEKDQSELSAAELDMVAGGKLSSNSLGYQLSLSTLGIGCAVMSALYEFYHAIGPDKNCVGALNTEI